MTEKEKMLAGQIYDPSDEELLKLRQNAHILSKKYNDCFETDAQRTDLLHELIPHMGENVYLQGPVQFDYGCFTEIGKNTYANFNFTCLELRTGKNRKRRIYRTECIPADTGTSVSVSGQKYVPACRWCIRRPGICQTDYNREQLLALPEM